MDVNRFVDPLRGLRPEKIILFGSYAYGTPTEDSDVDLLVVLQTKDPFHERIQKIRSFLPEDQAIDLIVLTPEEYERTRSSNPLIKEIAEKGQVVYG